MTWNRMPRTHIYSIYEWNSEWHTGKKMMIIKTRRWALDIYLEHFVRCAVLRIHCNCRAFSPLFLHLSLSSRGVLNAGKCFVIGTARHCDRNHVRLFAAWSDSCWCVVRWSEKNVATRCHSILAFCLDGWRVSRDVWNGKSQKHRFHWS